MVVTPGLKTVFPTKFKRERRAVVVCVILRLARLGELDIVDVGLRSERGDVCGDTDFFFGDAELGLLSAGLTKRRREPTAAFVGAAEELASTPASLGALTFIENLRPPVDELSVPRALSETFFLPSLDLSGMPRSKEPFPRLDIKDEESEGRNDLPAPAPPRDAVAEADEVGAGGAWSGSGGGGSSGNSGGAESGRPGGCAILSPQVTSSAPAGWWLCGCEKTNKIALRNIPQSC